jgi:hypothetical protein
VSRAAKPSPCGGFCLKAPDDHYLAGQELRFKKPFGPHLAWIGIDDDCIARWGHARQYAPRQSRRLGRAVALVANVPLDLAGTIGCQLVLPVDQLAVTTDFEELLKFCSR